MEGAAQTIREECERLFCETMKTVFLGERDPICIGSSALGANAYSPPDESVDMYNYLDKHETSRVNSWLEVWDYASGYSFRGFVAGVGEKICLFIFFSSPVLGRDLKQGLMALIELAGSPFRTSQVVICIDRSVEPEESNALLKSLRWVGFELITLDLWAKKARVTSDKWLFLGMEI